MERYKSFVSISASVIIALCLSLILDNILIIIFVGFISTYLTKTEYRSSFIGALSSTIVGVIIFLTGIFKTPDLPLNILKLVNFDLQNTIIGCLFVAGISAILGLLSGLIANTILKYKLKE
jgi:hypothetical protein